MIDAIEIGYAIKDRRAELGLTQAQLAEAAGVSKRCLWSLEMGRNLGVQFDKLTAVLGALGLDLAILAPDAAEPALGAATGAAHAAEAAADGANGSSNHEPVADAARISKAATGNTDATAADAASAAASPDDTESAGGGAPHPIDALAILTRGTR